MQNGNGNGRQGVQVQPQPRPNNGPQDYRRYQNQSVQVQAWYNENNGHHRSSTPLVRLEYKETTASALSGMNFRFKFDSSFPDLHVEVWVGDDHSRRIVQERISLGKVLRNGSDEASYPVTEASHPIAVTMHRMHPPRVKIKLTSVVPIAPVRPVVNQQRR